MVFVFKILKGFGNPLFRKSEKEIYKVDSIVIINRVPYQLIKSKKVTVNK